MASDSAPRICLIAGFFPPSYSGASLQALALLKSLNKENISSFVVTIQRDNLLDHEVIEGIPVYRVSRPSGGLAQLQLIRFWIRLFIILFLKRNSYDIIHIIGAHLQLGIVGVFARILGKKSLVKITLVESDLACIGKGRWGKLQKFAMKCIDRYVSISQETRAELVQSGLQEAKIADIPNGVDTERFSPCSNQEKRNLLKKELGLPETPLITFVGIVDYRKGIDTLIKAWEKIKSEQLDGSLLLLGPEDNSPPDYFSNSIRDYAKDKAITDSVIFWGRDTRVPDFLRVSDIMILPSRGEGLPNVVLEGMASGVPIIASDRACTTSIMSDKHEGLVFQCDNHVDLFEKIKQLLMSPNLAIDMGLNGKARIESSSLSLAQITNKYEKLYYSLLE
ncbi:glycosyltransferase family 4 protein [Teredinibacter haidensis]|uniref:glycosyltransferase family 4 protein n=1 Tax=Teredinibacter haidensis TaxID=2731755 RepID=UPI000948E026|nr:glycosyltransferase family 4 protein [Teredinibacter haidensis]